MCGGTLFGWVGHILEHQLLQLTPFYLILGDQLLVCLLLALEVVRLLRLVCESAIWIWRYDAGLIPLRRLRCSILRLQTCLIYLLLCLKQRLPLRRTHIHRVKWVYPDLIALFSSSILYLQICLPYPHRLETDRLSCAKCCVASLDEAL